MTWSRQMRRPFGPSLRRRSFRHVEAQRDAAELLQHQAHGSSTLVELLELLPKPCSTMKAGRSLVRRNLPGTRTVPEILETVRRER